MLLSVSRCAVLAALCALQLAASTLTGSSGAVQLSIGGRAVNFSPDGAPNLAITGPFDTAVPGMPFAAELTQLDLASSPEVFTHGTYIIGLQLEPLTHSNGQVTATGPGAFSSFFDVFFAATFNMTAPGSSDGSGDVLGEFGGLPGITNCINGAGVSTCELRTTLTIGGGFDAAGSTLTGVAVATGVPEPAAWMLLAPALLLGLRRRRS